MPEETAACVDIDCGTPNFGLWCEPCSLPSAFTIRVYILTADGVTDVGEWTGCTECAQCQKSQSAA